jgi:hypothetical protein
VSGFDEIVLMEGDALAAFLVNMDMVCNAYFRQGNTPGVYQLRFAIDEDGLKVKVNDYSWSPARGRMVVS